MHFKKSFFTSNTFNQDFPKYSFQGLAISEVGLGKQKQRAKTWHPSKVSLPIGRHFHNCEKFSVWDRLGSVMKLYALMLLYIYKGYKEQRLPIVLFVMYMYLSHFLQINR